MCSAIIARNIFIINAVYTVLQDLLLPPSPQVKPKLSVTTTDGLVLWYPISHKIYEGISCVFMCVHAWIFTLHKHAWIHMNFAWTHMNFTWTHMKVDQNFRVCSRFLGHMTSVWNRHPNFCGSVWRSYYSTQNMWNSFTSIINTYTVASIFMPQPLLGKSAIFAMNKYICLWREKG